MTAREQDDHFDITWVLLQHYCGSSMSAFFSIVALPNIFFLVCAWHYFLGSCLTFCFWPVPGIIFLARACHLFLPCAWHYVSGMCLAFFFWLVSGILFLAGAWHYFFGLCLEIFVFVCAWLASCYVFGPRP